MHEWNLNKKKWPEMRSPQDGVPIFTSASIPENVLYFFCKYNKQYKMTLTGQKRFYPHGY